uniref:Uncharacterized protein n=1 Tax=Glossina austeni TaxID=7395 RepID=A0A1A9VGR9_GLOAU
MNEYPKREYSITKHVVKLYERSDENTRQPAVTTPPKLTPQNLPKVSIRKFNGERLKWVQFSELLRKFVPGRPRRRAISDSGSQINIITKRARIFKTCYHVNIRRRQNNAQGHINVMI